MALPTNKTNKIIADWKAGRFNTAYAISKEYKIDQKTAKKIITNIENIEKNNKKIKSNTKRGFLYLLRAGNSDYYKIGITANNLKKRVSSVQTGNHLTITVEDYVICSNIDKKEKKLHTKYNDFRTIREWFIFDDISEIKKDFDLIRKSTVLEQEWLN